MAKTKSVRFGEARAQETTDKIMSKENHNTRACTNKRVTNRGTFHAHLSFKGNVDVEEENHLWSEVFALLLPDQFVLLEHSRKDEH